MKPDQKPNAVEASYNEDPDLIPPRPTASPPGTDQYYNTRLPPPPAIPEGASAADRLRIESGFGTQIAQAAANRRYVDELNRAKKEKLRSTEGRIAPALDVVERIFGRSFSSWRHDLQVSKLSGLGIRFHRLIRYEKDRYINKRIPRDIYNFNLYEWLDRIDGAAAHAQREAKGVGGGEVKRSRLKILSDLFLDIRSDYENFERTQRSQHELNQKPKALSPEERQNEIKKLEERAAAEKTARHGDGSPLPH